MTNFKHSTPEGRAHVRSALDHLNAKGEEFIADHPFFGQEAKFPKTVARVKALAVQLSNGSITMDEAYSQADQAIEAECHEHISAGKQLSELAFI